VFSWNSAWIAGLSLGAGRRLAKFAPITGYLKKKMSPSVDCSCPINKMIKLTKKAIEN
jgi:hypothetical protein